MSFEVRLAIASGKGEPGGRGARIVWQRRGVSVVRATEMRQRMRTQRIAVWAVAGIVAMPIAGCRVEKSTHGDSKDVTISTPFGGMHVKTNGQDVPASMGMAVYPGAQAVYDDGNDNQSADVDMSFGHFQLRVKKASYRTNDAPDKVEAFYRTE